MYADREHSANLAFLTGFDPRFEESVLVLGPAGDPAILVGNECHDLAGAAPLPMRRALFQDLSLPGQPRDRSRSLAEILGNEGIRPGTRVGVIGWKMYAHPEMSDAPAYLVDELRRLAGATGRVENATHLLIDAADGLRVINEVEQLAVFEHASCHTSDGVRRLLWGLRPGMRERQQFGMRRHGCLPIAVSGRTGEHLARQRHRPVRPEQERRQEGGEVGERQDVRVQGDPERLAHEPAARQDAAPRVRVAVGEGRAE